MCGFVNRSMAQIYFEEMRTDGKAFGLFDAKKVYKLLLYYDEKNQV